VKIKNNHWRYELERETAIEQRSRQEPLGHGLCPGSHRRAATATTAFSFFCKFLAAGFLTRLTLGGMRFLRNRAR
jgi:hypothetical protein